MKNIFSKMIIAGLILVSPLTGLAADGAPAVKKVSTKADKAKEKEDAQKPAANAALVAILNQITLAKLDFDTDLSVKILQKNDKSSTEIDFKYLDISMLVKFKDQLLYTFVDEEKTAAQVKKVVPAVSFTTKDMYVVSKVKAIEKGKMRFSVRFCQSYSQNNDYCNTLEDKKLLDISVKSTNFGMFDMRIKDINIDFEQKLAEGKFSFVGTCTAWKSGFDIETPDKTIMKPAVCEFSGVYDSKAVVKFDGNFKLKTKK